MKLKIDARQASLFDFLDLAVLEDPAQEVPACKSEIQVAVEDVVHSRTPRRNLFVLQDEMLAHLSSDSAKIDANIKAIETLRTMRAKGRMVATDEERRAMVAYSGWGGLSNVFATNTKYQQAQERLRELLTPAEYDGAQESVLSAYYTEPSVVRAIWSIVQRMGFKGGRVLEPSCGTGNFIGAMPEDLRHDSRVVMIDPDPITAALADELYADRQTTVMPIGLQDLGIRENGAFDLVIGNAPFGNYRVSDARLDKLKLNIHNYFLIKSIELVRPGGIVALITTSSTLENGARDFLAHLCSRAELKMAIRLPSAAFARLGGTDVVADVLILQRRDKVVEVGPWDKTFELPNKANADRANCTANYTYWAEASKVNAIFVKNPHWVLGKYTLASNRWGSRLGVEAHEDWQQRLSGLCEEASIQGVFDCDRNVVQGQRAQIADPKAIKSFVAHGFFFDEEGRLMVIEGNNSVSDTENYPAHQLRRLEGMTRIRDCVLQLLEADSVKSTAAEQYRAELNRIYDGFVKHHGFLMDAGNRRLYRNDSHAPLLWSLEIWDDEQETALKADIFRESTVSNAVLKDSADTIEDAIALSYNRFGRLETSWMARAMGVPEGEVIERLLASDRIYQDPRSGKWVDSMEYLSGPVREKLRIAEAAAKGDQSYGRNVVALKAVVPPNIPLEQVGIKLGVPWIGEEHIRQWLEETFKIGRRYLNEYSGFPHTSLEVTQVVETASWVVSFGYPKHETFTTKWGTSRKNFWDILGNLLNQQTPEVYDTIEVEGKERRVINKDESLAAQEMARTIEKSFVDWLMSDKDRVQALQEKYNMLYNGHVNRSYDGSHLVIPGLSAAITLRDAQKDSIWRGIVSGNTLYALAVGGGKTLIQICVAQELKRLGVANKPILVVPNHMLEAFAGEYLRAFPRAKVLAASKDDLVGDARRELLMRIATNDWDCVIVTHSTFGRIGLSDEVVKEFISEQKLKAREAVMGVTDQNVVREASRAAKMVETKLQSLISDGKDSGVLGFEKLGIDTVLVDEADLFKNLFFFTKKKRIPGISSSCSSRALDLYLKSRVIFEKRGNDGYGLCFATATPISNTIGEMFIMQTYLQEARLRELAIDSFDAWAANFAREVTCVEVKPEGSGYRLHTRFASFVNVPELMRIFREVAEIRTKKQLNLPEPKLVGGSHTVVTVPPTEGQRRFVQSLVERAERVRTGEVKPEVDNMLCITNDGRKAALDMRCVNPTLAAEPGTKVEACIERVYAHWEQSIQERLTQLVFCDLSVPGNSFSVYEHIKAALIAKGVPAEEIAFAQDFKTDRQKAQLHRMVRAGKKRVLIGSTELMGFGTNVQDRLVAKHDLDAPWRPRDVEQRDGRIIRQGNMNEEVWIYRYATESTFDVYMWQGLERKASFIAQVMENNGSVRTVEDVSMQALSFAEVKALASGNPMVIEKAGVDAEVARLQALKSVHNSDQYKNRREVVHLEAAIASARDHLHNVKALRESAKVDGRGYVVDGKRYADFDACAEAVLKRGQKIRKFFKDHRDRRSAHEPRVLLEMGNVAIEIEESWSAGPVEQVRLDGQAFTMRLRSLPRNLEDLIECFKPSWFEEEITYQMTKTETRLRDLQASLVERQQASRPFAHEEKLQALLERQAEIDSMLEINTDDASALACAE